MTNSISKERKQRATRKAKKMAYKKQMALLRAVQKMESLEKRKLPRMSAKQWFANKRAWLYRVINRGHASINQAANDIQRDIIAAAIAKRERKAIDIYGMRCG